MEHASLIRPCPGEWVSGDATTVRPLEEGVFAAIVDVLGHGPEAHELAQVIDGFLERYAGADVAAVMARLHAHVRGSRGAAAGLCSIDTASGRVCYVGTGNTVLRRFGRAETRLVSQDGVLGQNMRTPKVQTLQLDPDDLLVLYTDGVRDRFTAEDYPGLFHQPPAEVVRNVIRRFGKDHDDAACIALRFTA